MRFTRWILTAALYFTTALASADLLPPGAIEAGQRLRDHPGAFDRSDNFCEGKQAGASCVIPGPLLVGGGAGICRNDINRNLGLIDLSCNRSDTVDVDRKLPEAGFVYDADLCRMKDASGNPLRNCTPLVPAPSDQFCAGKEVGASCSVSFRYQGKTEQQVGVCKSQLQTFSFYQMGRRTASREVVLCQPAEEATERSYKAVGWWQKLWQ